MPIDNIQLKDVRNLFNQNITTDKKALMSTLPECLTKGSMKKQWTDLPKKITEKQFVENILRHQINTEQSIVFDYLAEYYNLTIDNYGRLEFNEIFPFDNKIKKEAFFKYSIWQFIKKDDMLNQFKNYLKCTSQVKFNLEYMSSAFNQRFDWCMLVQRLVFEIDENHPNDSPMDKIKTDTMRLNGFNLIRLNFQNIHKGPILNNINEEWLSSAYYVEFLKDVKDKIVCSLLKDNRDVREYYIMHLFENSLLEEINDITIYLINNIAEEKECIKCIKNSKNLDEYTNYYNEYQTILKETEFNKQSLTHYTNLLDGLYNDDNFLKLFDLKDKCRIAKYKAVITFNEISEILYIKSKDGKYEFKSFLRKMRVIKTLDILDEDILVSWEQLSIVVIKYKSSIMSKLLTIYYIKIEKSYEHIIECINKHNNSIQGDIDAYNSCMDYSNKQFKKIEIKELKDLRKKVDKLTLDNEAKDEKLKMYKTLETRYTSVQQEQNNSNNIVNHQNRKDFKQKIIMRQSDSKQLNMIDTNNLQIVKEIGKKFKYNDKVESDDESFNDAELSDE